MFPLILRGPSRGAKTWTRLCRTYTESAPDRGRVALPGLVLPSNPADAHGAQDDARHSQAHFQQGEHEQAPQDLAAGAHPAPRGISPAPAGGGANRRSSELQKRRGSIAPCPVWRQKTVQEKRSDQKPQRRLMKVVQTDKSGEAVDVFEERELTGELPPPPRCACLCGAIQGIC